jgi:hypothetical protein
VIEVRGDPVGISSLIEVRGDPVGISSLRGDYRGGGGGIWKEVVIVGKFLIFSAKIPNVCSSV